MATRGINIILLSFPRLLLLVESSYSQTHKLLQRQMLGDGRQLISAFGNFRLGFFRAGDASNFRYLGIWYYQGIWYYHEPYREGEYKPVWVANRNTPILCKESVSLTIDSSDGNLKILWNGGNPIAVSSVQGASNTVVSASLLQSGNFVLNELNLNGSIKRMLWQSFDYPTDTLLPGMKLEINLKTGHKWFLQSWITDASPVQGSFTLGMDPNLMNRLIVWWRGEFYSVSRFWLNGSFKSSLSEYEFMFLTSATLQMNKKNTSAIP